MLRYIPVHQATGGRWLYATTWARTAAKLAADEVLVLVRDGLAATCPDEATWTAFAAGGAAFEAYAVKAAVLAAPGVLPHLRR